jgi:NTP pyrophosphatase (non-canonical NTP hydrolase)
MNLHEYTKATNETAIYPEAGTGARLEFYYLALGLTSEAGEVAGKIKKLIRDDTYDQEALAQELGDIFWYLVRLCTAIGITPEEVLQKNIDKLMNRKRKGTLRGSGDER